MNFAIENIRIVEEEYLDNFVFKKEITEVEAYGLEVCLVKLLVYSGYKIEEAYDTVNTYTRHLKDCLDVLNGSDDILYIGCYKVISAYVTENDIVILKCLKDEYEYYEDEDSIYYISIG